jgi:hypothetical protein
MTRYLSYHPLANLFPLIEGEAFQQLVADVREHGVREPVVLLDGKILDGRNRYRAGLQAGFFTESPEGSPIPQPQYMFDHYDAELHGEPLAWVLSKNLERRHLTDDQRRMVAARIVSMQGGRPSKTVPNGTVSRKQAAALLSVDERGVKDARAVVRSGAAELQDAVDQRRVTVRMAADLAALPVEQQREILASADPGTIKDAVRNIRHAIGTRSASKEEKGDQLYETPEAATRALIALEGFSSTFKEPAVGRGAILRVMEAAGYDAVIADLRDREIATRDGVLQGVEDFLTSRVDQGIWADTCGMDIITNPPYDDLANAFLAHALRVHKPGKMAALLNSNFMFGFEDADRRYLMQENPPSRVYLHARRLPMMHRDGWEGKKASSQMNTAWFVWERNEDGSYGRGNGRFEAIRVDWKDFQQATPIAPGERLYLDPDEFPEAEESFERETPRRTLEERVEDDRARALLWIAEQDHFDDVTLRRGIGVRPSTAEALIETLRAGGLIEVEGTEPAWKISPAGMRVVRLALDVADATDAALSQVPATTPALPDADDLYARAVALVRDTKQPSTSMLQRRLGIGWDEASDLIERMTAEKVLPLEKIKADGKRKAVAA